MSASAASRLSVIIPTFGRPDFILRTLRYYAAVGFDGELLVGDSSGPDEVKRVRDYLAGPGRTLKVEYFESPELAGTLERLSALVRTPYVALHGDDDIIFPSAAAQCVERLDADAASASAHGRGWLFTVAPSGATGRVELGVAYPLATPQPDSPLARLEALLGDYKVTLFSVHRTAAWQAMWSGAARIADRTFSAELLPCCRSAVLGKCVRLDIPYLLRQTHAARYHLPVQLDWRKAPGWKSDFHQVCEALAVDVRRGSEGREAPSAGDIAAIFERDYLCRAPRAEDPPAGRMAARRLRERLIDTIERLPVAAGSLRRARAALRLARVRSSVGDPQLRRELDLFVATTAQRSA